MIVSLVLDALHNLVPLFDRSSQLVRPSTSSLVRWDAIHFLATAERGYQYEQQWAFLPGISTTIRSFNGLLGHEHGLKGVSLLISLLTVDSFRVLHELSRIHLGSDDLAHITCVLALIPSSPATLFAAPYNEPFFTYLSYRGMLFCARRQWLLATLSFAAATGFRSNGMFLAGFLIWGILIDPSLPQLPRLSIRTLLSAIYAAILTWVVFLPFLYHNYTGYNAFCMSDVIKKPEWCSRSIPSIYTHVQSKYWGGGLFKYWTIQQLPNFILGGPPLILLFTFGVWHLRNALPTLFKPHMKPTPKLQGQTKIIKGEAESTEPKPTRDPPNPFGSLSLTPHVIHSLFMSSVLLFASHTQIVLRLGAAMPTLYWAAAWLWYQPAHLRSSQKYGRWWVYWSAIWGMVSIVLWVAFLPPA